MPVGLQLLVVSRTVMHGDQSRRELQANRGNGFKCMGVYIIFISFLAVFIVLNNIYLNLILYIHNYSNMRMYMKYAV